ncbi:cytochrome P450 [Mycena latifolia]|nr:cytochrome P450 [Mycena latifolia]
MALTLFQMALLAGVLYLANIFFRRDKRLPLPPGPTGLPIVGNILDVPQNKPWLAFLAMGAKFNSDILYLNLLGSPTIVLNSVQAAEDLLDKRSAIYSDRPNIVMLTEVSGAGWNMGLMQYGQRWKDVRKVFHQGYQASLSSQIPLYQLQAARMLLQRLLHNPDNFPAHLRLMSAQIILAAAYGIDVVSEHDPYVDIASRAMDAVAKAGVPGSYIAVQAFPLKHLPSWFPGAGFKRQGKKWSVVQNEMRARPLKFLKDSMAPGTARPSIGSDLIYAMEEAKTTDDPYEQEILKDTLAVLYFGGTDTTMAPIYTFFLAMVTHKDVQHEAQKAVDDAVGSTRLPHPSDDIPYVDAIVKELLRWRPVSSIFGHALKLEDVYRGYRIPAGSTVLFNQWAMLHDKTVFGPDADEFRPSRWLKDGRLDPAMPSIDPAFGFGRRFCPGQEMALKSIWIAVASLLATLNITYSLDKNGDPILPSGVYTKGVFSHPEPFECTITPRSEEAKALIESGI